MKNVKKNKMLLIFPPQWTPISPHFAIPSLIGQLKSKGYNAEALDLNIEFFNDVLSKQYIEKSIFMARKEFENLKENLLNVFSPEKKADDYKLEEQIFLYKYRYLKNYLSENEKYLNFIPNVIDKAVNFFKTEEFYNPMTLIQSLNVIDRALQIISLPYSPMRIEMEQIANPFFKFNYETIKYFVLDKSSNIFIEYYEDKIKEILDKKSKFIAISLNSSSQIMPGLTLTYLLKQKTNAHINIGGNFFGRITDELLNHKEFFELFADSVSIEEGEGPIVEFARFINNEIPIENVPNLIYIKDEKLFKNEKIKPLKLNEIANINLDDYDLKKYFSPQIVLPFQSSRGCYWGKCSFCDQDFGMNFNSKNVDKVISEFKELKEKYKIDNFEFIDESVSPSYMNELSDRLNKENVSVSYFCDARLETAFTKEILEKAHENGLKMIMWGLESGSNKVLELINKGIDLEKRFEILKDAKEAGIWNFAFIFFGFPTETVEDAKKTVKMLVDNKDIIHSYGRSVFSMGRHAKLSQEPEKYGITKIYPAEEEFSPNINFDSIGMNKQELGNILEYCKIQCSIAYNKPLWMFLRYREWLFLYVAKYGCDWVKQFDVTAQRS
ncbi:MAG: radical SAM protein [Candidatus Gastranaerophilales bacterium]|nr:radical SAM protein [Candidatus Gastranaerophilales bacterium]